MNLTMDQFEKANDQAKTDWITFWTSAHHMTEEEVEAQIKTPAVLQAFERAKLSNLPADVRAAYDAEVREHDHYSQHIAEQISKGEKSAKIKVARISHEFNGGPN